MFVHRLPTPHFTRCPPPPPKKNRMSCNGSTNGSEQRSSIAEACDIVHRSLYIVHACDSKNPLSSRRDHAFSCRTCVVLARDMTQCDCSARARLRVGRNTNTSRTACDSSRARAWRVRERARRGVASVRHKSVCVFVACTQPPQPP